MSKYYSISPQLYDDQFWWKKDDIEFWKQIFLNNSEKIWGDLFDYSNVDYVDSKTNVTIICKKHGGFHRTPNDHTHKNKPTGCPDCEKKSRSEKIRTSIQKFIKKSIKIFGAIYDYSDVTLIKNVDTSFLKYSLYNF